MTTGEEPSAAAKAQQIMYDAWGAETEEIAIKMAHAALEVSPDAADAFNLLAERSAESVEEAAELYRKGVEAGERALGPDMFVEAEGHFWGVLETRPYMRARAGLADCLWRLGKKSEAAEHYQEMLRLNPGDNQGIRYLLAARLYELQRLDDLEALLGKYDEDGFAVWAYMKALLSFRRDGDCDDSRMLLTRALESNTHVPAYLLGEKRMPQKLPDYLGFGDENEAVALAYDYRDAWVQTPAALDWLRSQRLGTSFE